jgi:hypothetical protein
LTEKSLAVEFSVAMTPVTPPPLPPKPLGELPLPPDAALIANFATAPLTMMPLDTFPPAPAGKPEPPLDAAIESPLPDKMEPV